MARTERGLAARAAMLAVLAAVAGVGAGCTGFENALATIPVFNFLHNSPAFDPYEAPRPAPAGAVPFAAPEQLAPYPPMQPTEAALLAFGAAVTNPFPVTEATLAEGKALFERYCAVCHGPLGRGNGPVVGPERFPYAPDLLLPITVNRTDGYLYGIIRVGRGLMPPYGDKVPHAGRWYIVQYLRWLQQNEPATPPAAAGSPAGGAQTPAGAPGAVQPQGEGAE